jgi:transposase InsO family protein
LRGSNNEGKQGFSTPEQAQKASHYRQQSQDEPIHCPAGDCVAICRERPNLLEQEFHCVTPNTVWLADITYINTGEGWLYLAGIKDMATREIVGWAMEDHMRAELCCDALEMALGRRGPVPGLIHHSTSRDHAAHNPAGQWTEAASTLVGTIAS